MWRVRDQRAPCTPKTVLTSCMGSLAPRSWHLITETVNGVACRIHHHTTTTVRAPLCERPVAPQHHERNRRSTCDVHGTAEVSHHGYWMRRAAARFHMVLPITDALWRIMVLSNFRHAVHGSIVAVICACLSMGLCYAMPQHHRMDHKLLVVCMCCFAHHHGCSTFATLDEKWLAGAGGRPPLPTSLCLWTPPQRMARGNLLLAARSHCLRQCWRSLAPWHGIAPGSANM